MRLQKQSRRSRSGSPTLMADADYNRIMSKKTEPGDIRANHLNRLAHSKDVPKNSLLRKVFYPILQVIMVVLMGAAVIQEPGLLTYGAILGGGIGLNIQRGSANGMNFRKQRVRIGAPGSGRYAQRTVMYKAAERNTSNSPAQQRQRGKLPLLSGIASVLNNKGFLNSYFKQGAGINGGVAYQRWMSYHLNAENNTVVECEDGQAYIDWRNIKPTYGNFTAEITPYQPKPEDIPTDRDDCDRFVSLHWAFDCGCDNIFKDACLMILRIAVNEDGKLSKPTITTTKALYKDCKALVNLKDNDCKKQYTYAFFSNADATYVSTSIYLGTQDFVPPVMPLDVSCCLPCDNKSCCDCKCEPPDETPIFCGCGHPDASIDVKDIIYGGGADIVGIQTDLYHYPDKPGTETGCGCDGCYSAIVSPDVVADVVASIIQEEGIDPSEISFNETTGVITMSVAPSSMNLTVSTLVLNDGPVVIGEPIGGQTLVVVNFIEGACLDSTKENRSIPVCLALNTTEVFRIIEGSKISAAVGDGEFNNATELLSYFNANYGGVFTIKSDGKIHYEGSNFAMAGEDFIMTNSEGQNVLGVFNYVDCDEPIKTATVEPDGAFGDFDRDEEVYEEPEGEGEEGEQIINDDPEGGEGGEEGDGPL